MDGVEDLAAVHAALDGDVEVVRAYGEEHQDSWVGVWFENEPTVRVVAAFSGNLAAHDEMLRPRLAHPDRLILEQRRYSLAALNEVRAEVERLSGRRAGDTGRKVLSSLGERKGVIHATLRADQEDFASELASRFGDAVELQVGEFTFPDRRRAHPPSQIPPLEEVQFEGLELRVELDRRSLEVGDDGHGRLVLQNGGSERIGVLVSDQPLVGVLLDASQQRVGGYSGWIAGTEVGIDLAPGEITTIPVLFGTASLQEHLGYVLPVGIYWLRVQVRFSCGILGGGPTHLLTAPLTPVTLVSRLTTGDT